MSTSLEQSYQGNDRKLMGHDWGTSRYTLVGYDGHMGMHGAYLVILRHGIVDVHPYTRGRIL